MAERYSKSEGHLNQPSPIASEQRIRTADDVELSARLYLPHKEAPRAIVICAHAMMVDMRTFEKSGFANVLASRGYGVFVFNFRGRDPNAPSDWSYEDLLQQDVPAVIDKVSELMPELPSVWLGHSLGGHVGLAAHGCNHLSTVHATVLISTNVWLPSLEHNLMRRFRKSLYMLFGRVMVGLFGTVPVVRLGVGTVDEAPTYLKDLIAWWKNDCWGTTQEGPDYLSTLKNLESPVLSVVGSDDRIEAHPDAVRAFLEAFQPKNSTVLIADHHWTGGKVPTDHMRLITSRHSAPGWHQICDWLDEWVTS